MNKNAAWSVSLLAGLALALGAAGTQAQTGAAPLKVVVTIKPIHALALQVLDGVAEPTLVVDGSASPHTYALKPSDAKLMNDADVVIRASESLEPFTARIVKSLPKTVQVVTLENAPNLVILPRRTGAAYETGSHGKGHAGHKHDHAPKKGKADIDGHFWLDPVNAKAIATEIGRIAAAKRPAGATRIAENVAKATARLDALDKDLGAALTPVKTKPYVVFHDALQYLEARYGLAPVGAITVDPEVPPSAKRLTDLRNRIKTLSAACVFAEPGYEQRVVQSVIEGTTAKSALLDPEGLKVDRGADAYDRLLRGIAASLAGCLGS